MAKFCPRSCWMTPKLFFTQIEFLVFDALWFISVSYSDWIAQVHSTKSWLFLTKNLTIFWNTESGNTLSASIQSKVSYQPIRAVGAGVKKAIDQSEQSAQFCGTTLTLFKALKFCLLLIAWSFQRWELLIVYDLI